MPQPTRGWPRDKDREAPAPLRSGAAQFEPADAVPRAARSECGAPQSLVGRARYAPRRQRRALAARLCSDRLSLAALVRPHRQEVVLGWRPVPRQPQGGHPRAPERDRPRSRSDARAGSGVAARSPGRPAEARDQIAREPPPTTLDMPPVPSPALPELGRIPQRSSRRSAAEAGRRWGQADRAGPRTTPPRRPRQDNPLRRRAPPESRQDSRAPSRAS